MYICRVHNGDVFPQQHPAHPKYHVHHIHSTLPNTTLLNTTECSWSSWWRRRPWQRRREGCKAPARWVLVLVCVVLCVLCYDRIGCEVLTVCAQQVDRFIQSLNVMWSSFTTCHDIYFCLLQNLCRKIHTISNQSVVIH